MVKLPEEITGEKLLDTDLGDDFLDLILYKEKASKAKINTWHYIKLKSCTSKETINKMKRQST